MRDDLRNLVDDLVRDSAERVRPEQQDRAITMAGVQYSKDKPRRVVTDVAAPGGQRMPIPPGTLRVERIEYPAGLVSPAILPSTAWAHYHGPDGVELIINRRIAAGDPVRLTLLCPHVLTEDASTIPESDYEAVASYAAAVLFDQIAGATSGDGNPTVPADTVDHGSKPENFAKRAERLRQRYYDLLGIDVKRTQPASAMAVQPLGASDGGMRMTHRRRWRR